MIDNEAAVAQASELLFNDKIGMADGGKVCKLGGTVIFADGVGKPKDAAVPTAAVPVAMMPVEFTVRRPTSDDAPGNLAV
jgi:hypothetical protein